MTIKTYEVDITAFKKKYTITLMASSERLAGLRASMTLWSAYRKGKPADYKVTATREAPSSPDGDHNG